MEDIVHLFSQIEKNTMGVVCDMYRRPEGKRPLGRPRGGREDNIKINIQEVEWEDMDWTDLAQDRDKRRAQD